MHAPPTKRLLSRTLLLLILAATTGSVLISPRSAQASETVLYSFAGGNNGADPVYNLIADPSGNLYGVTFSGGSENAGTVFELSLQQGAWVESVLYSFGATSGDGILPSGRLSIDSAGNLYGVTELGGAKNYGTVYELTPNGGKWTESILYSFTSAANTPFGGLTFDTAGNIYGTTLAGGTSCPGGCGVAYKLSPPNAKYSTWQYTRLYRFLGFAHNDGQQPNGDLVFDAAGNLYGTTYYGGTAGAPYGNGTVFKLTPGAKAWTGKVLYSFKGGTTDGQYPTSGLSIDSSGNLYGTTIGGGVANVSCIVNGTCGTVFELALNAKKVWKEKLLYSFQGANDGGNPDAPVTLNAGILYGTAAEGGSSGAGTVFQVTISGGKGTEAPLYSFTGSPDGSAPIGGVVLDSAGDIYGTTSSGGTQGDGIVYEITP